MTCAPNQIGQNSRLPVYSTTKPQDYNLPFAMTSTYQSFGSSEDQARKKEEYAKIDAVHMRLVNQPIPHGFSAWAPMLQVILEKPDPKNPTNRVQKRVLYQFDPSNVYLGPFERSTNGPATVSANILYKLVDPVNKIEKSVPVVLQKTEWTRTKWGAKISQPAGKRTWVSASFDSAWNGMDTNAKLRCEFWTLKAFEERLIDLVYEQRETILRLGASTPRDVIAQFMKDRMTAPEAGYKDPSQMYLPKISYVIPKKPGGKPNAPPQFDVVVFQQGSAIPYPFSKLVEMYEGGDKQLKHRTIFYHDKLVIAGNQFKARPVLQQVIVPECKSNAYSMVDVVPDMSASMASFMALPAGGSSTGNSGQAEQDDGGASPMVD